MVELTREQLERDTSKGDDSATVTMYKNTVKMYIFLIHWFVFRSKKSPLGVQSNATAKGSKGKVITFHPCDYNVILVELHPIIINY